jgi:hypothetical protein
MKDPTEMKHEWEPTFGIEHAAESSDQLPSALALSADKKADVMINTMSIYHSNIVSWITRSYEIATWSLAAEYVAVAYFYVHNGKLDILSTVILLLGFCAFGLITQLYLRAAARAHFGNRLGISKCEAALGLYGSGNYLAERRFFTYSRRMLSSTNLNILRWFHAVGTATAIGLLVLLNRIQ